MGALSIVLAVLAIVAAYGTGAGLGAAMCRKLSSDDGALFLAIVGWPVALPGMFAYWLCTRDRDHVRLPTMKVHRDG